MLIAFAAVTDEGYDKRGLLLALIGAVAYIPIVVFAATTFWNVPAPKGVGKHVLGAASLATVPWLLGMWTSLPATEWLLVSLAILAALFGVFAVDRWIRRARCVPEHS